MHFIRLIVATFLLTMCVIVIALNWAYFFMDRHNRYKSIPRRVSTITLASIIFSTMAYIAYPALCLDKGWIFLFPLIDVSNWKLAKLLVKRKKPI